jgi:single-strand DNA-binding protein
MADMSIAILIGRLTRDAELKYTNGGMAVCKFAIATSTRKKKGDQWVDEPNFWDVELWGKQGESLNQYLTKGKQVGVEGTMRQDHWEQEGVKRMKVIINANSVQLLGGKSHEDSPGQTSERSDGRNHAHGHENASQGANFQTQGNSRQPATVQTAGADIFSDDIPF